MVVGGVYRRLITVLLIYWSPGLFTESWSSLISVVLVVVKRPGTESKYNPFLLRRWVLRPTSRPKLPVNTCVEKTDSFTYERSVTVVVKPEFATVSVRGKTPF